MVHSESTGVHSMDLAAQMKKLVVQGTANSLVPPMHSVHLLHTAVDLLHSVLHTRLHELHTLGDVNVYSQAQEMPYPCSTVNFLFRQMCHPTVFVENVVSKVAQKGRLRCVSKKMMLSTFDICDVSSGLRNH